MFLVFSFKDISDTILSLVRIFILFFIFIYLPFAFLGAVWNVATSGSWYLVLGLVLAVAAFVYTTLKKQAAVSTVIGLACLALVAGILVMNHSLRSEEREALEFGSPRNVLWVESLAAINPYPVCRNECATFRPILPQSVRSVTDSANLDQRASFRFGEQARRSPDSIEILDYRIRPADLFDRYIEVAHIEGDWLAFHAQCVLDGACGRDTETVAGAVQEVRDRYGIDVPARLSAHLGMPGLTAGTMETSPDFAAACHADAPCRSVMSGLSWPVIIGASSGRPVVVHTR